MAGENSERPSEEELQLAEAQWASRRRTDLGNAFGIVLAAPPSNVDDDSQWKFGLSGSYMLGTEPTLELFQDEMTEIIRSGANELLEHNLISTQEHEQIRSEDYSIGAAAQEWPTYLFMLYQDARPVINDGASLIEWGVVLRWMIKGIKGWARNKNANPATRTKPLVDSTTGEETYTPGWMGVDLEPILTRPALISLCYQHLVSHYGIGGNVVIDSFPRGTVYSTPDHPGGAETYVFRLTTGERKFHYHVTCKAIVLEHFLVSGDDLTLLPFPDFGADDYFSYREILPSTTVRVPGS